MGRGREQIKLRMSNLRATCILLWEFRLGSAGEAIGDVIIACPRIDCTSSLALCCTQEFSVKEQCLLSVELGILQPPTSGIYNQWKVS